MIHRYFFQFLGRLSLLALSFWTATAALAQAAPETSTLQKTPPTAQKAPVTFQSALDGYSPYADEKIGNWKEANDRVARIGGWKAYAKEAAQTEPDPHAGHAGHTKPTQAQPTKVKP